MKPRIALAHWQGHDYRRYWGKDNFQSIWLTLRVLRNDGELEHSDLIYNISVSVFCSQGSAPCIEFRAHDVFAANVKQLRDMANWISAADRKLAKLPREYHIRPALLQALRAVGITEGVFINRNEISSEPLLDTLDRMNGVLDDLDAVTGEPRT
jgi:hypothetical protein